MLSASAMGFLQEHMTVDVAHNNLMEEYVRRLVRTPSDLSLMTYAMRVTGQLYADMLWGAMQSADHRRDFGLNAAELARC
jgi:pyrroloquinoline quinone (PQQ) biosynthesis protein C